MTDEFEIHFEHTKSDRFYLNCRHCCYDLRNALSYAESHDFDYEGLVLEIVKAK